MKERLAHFRHILLYYFRKVKNASQACRNHVRVVHGNEALKKKQRQNWFAKYTTLLENTKQLNYPTESIEIFLFAFSVFSFI